MGVVIPGGGGSLREDAASGAKILNGSLRFNSANTTTLTQTPSGTGTSRRIFTLSCWFKRTNFLTTSLDFAFLCAGNDPNNTYVGIIGSGAFGVSNNGKLCIGQNASVVARWDIELRDPSAWYHFVVAVDTNQATPANRQILYINGVQQIEPAGSITQNTDLFINHNVGRTIGGYNNPPAVGYYGNGYLTEYYLIDGQALDASYFGFTDPLTNTWRPKKYTGTYGTNGFYLPLDDENAKGTDRSGNRNNWTANNFSGTFSNPDVVPDGPSGISYSSAPTAGIGTTTGITKPSNYCTGNPLYIPSTQSRMSLTNGNLEWGQAATNVNCSMTGTFEMRSGKWYWEITVGRAAFAQQALGIQTIINTAWRGGGTVLYRSDGQKLVGGVNSAYGTSYAVDDVIGFAYDADAGSLTCYKNNVSQDVIYSSGTGNTWVPCIHDDNAGSGVTYYHKCNFGQRPLKYTPPTGFLPLCTANLPKPSIVRPDQYVGIVTYTGNGSTQSITGLGFQPDFVWIKSRNASGSHQLMDSVRGAGIQMYSDLTNAEAQGNYLTSFDNNGFSVSYNASGATNNSGTTYVAWAWKAGGPIGVGRSFSINGVGYATTTAAGLTAGTIPLTGASINTKSGFSIITWTGTGASSATIAHGLNALPNFVIIKKRNVIENWYISHSGSGQGINYAYHLFFTTAGLSGSNDPYYMGTQVSLTSNVLALADGTSNNGGNQSGTNYVAYCWTEIPGFSKFGSFTGNSNSDGVFVWCGFKPRYLLIKGTGSGGSGWIILDSVRDAYNASTKDLRADLNNSEPVSSGAVDFLSNGFKLRNTDTNYNSSSTSYGPYIFAAFAETPTQNLFGGQANAR